METYFYTIDFFFLALDLSHEYSERFPTIFFSGGFPKFLDLVRPNSSPDGFFAVPFLRGDVIFAKYHFTILAFRKDKVTAKKWDFLYVASKNVAFSLGLLSGKIRKRVYFKSHTCHTVSLYNIIRYWPSGGQADLVCIILQKQAKAIDLGNVVQTIHR